MICNNENHIKKLYINSENKFKILVIADIQDMRQLDKTKQEKLDLLIEISKPDLIVLLGDMFFGPFVLTKKKARQIIESILKPINNREVPFAFVSGNHDMDSFVKYDKQVKLYRQSPYCLTPDLSDRKCEGSYSLNVYDINDAPLIQLIFHDCGKTVLSLHGIKYGPASEEQIAYEKRMLKEYSDIPAFVFQHIPVPEINELITRVDKESIGAIKIKNQYMALKIPENGTLGEKPCPPDVNAGQLNNWKQNKNVKAAVFGHDHKNSFVGDVNGITLIQTACAGFEWPCYGIDEMRGGRILTIEKDGSFDTEELLYRDIVFAESLPNRSEKHA